MFVLKNQNKFVAQVVVVTPIFVKIKINVLMVIGIMNQQEKTLKMKNMMLLF